MPNLPLKRVAPATVNNSRLPLSKSHLTTTNFAELNVALCQEIVKKDSMNINTNLFVRTSPLVVPTYGRAYIRHLALFVPYSTIARDADAFIQGKRQYEGRKVYHRYITMDQIVNLLNTKEYSTSVGDPNASRYDYKYSEASGATAYKKLTNHGKYVYRLLQQLGYEIPYNVNLSPTSHWMQVLRSKKLNAYPIICFAKAYVDYVLPSTQYDGNPIVNLLTKIYDSNNDGDYISHDGHLLTKGLLEIFDNIFIPFNSDIFNSSWRYPNAPVHSTDLQDVNTISTYGTTRDSKSYVTSDDYSATTTLADNKISSRQLAFLRAFDKWARRNRLTGSNLAKRIYARFGVSSEIEDIMYTTRIKSWSVPMRIGDITSTAETADLPLGSYAGKAFANGDGNFSWNFKDYGHLFVFAWAMPEMIYKKQMDFSVLRTDNFDFYTPEFDKVGPEPIPLMAYSCDNKGNDVGVAHNPDDVLGFTERYNSYKVGLSRVTGDFCLYDTMDSWHFAINRSEAIHSQEPSMLFTRPSQSEFDRIFAITDGSVDNIMMSYDFDISADRPMLPTSFDPLLGSGGVIINQDA